jgi:hypothetical protein
MSNNLGLFEIKTPQSALLSKTPYREHLYGPAKDLVGAVSQILDQKYELQKNIAVIKENSRIYDLESYAVHGVLIIGKLPDAPDLLKSFDLFRSNSKDVSIFTFDELLEKLKLLLRFLSESSPEMMQASRIVNLETRLLRLQNACTSAFDITRSKSGGVFTMKSKPKRGVDGKKINELIGASAVLKTGFERARLEQPPFPICFDNKGNRVITAKSVEDFLEQAEKRIAESEVLFNAAFPSAAVTVDS